MWRISYQAVVWTGMVLLIAGFLMGCNSGPPGAELYTLNCAGCHGTAGKGGLATALSVPAYLNSHDATSMTRSTREGIPNTAMRAFSKANGGALTDEQIALIVLYLRSTRSAN